MNLWKQLRIPLLILTFVNVGLIFGRSIFDPNIGSRQVTRFEFPSAVPLPEWQLVASQPLKDEVVERPPAGKLVLPGRQYDYTQNDLPLNIKMRYEIETEGDFQQVLAENPALKSSKIMMRQHEQLGFYSLYTNQKRAYLTACINSRGGSTFTKEQFDSNRRRYDVQFSRIMPWLLAQQPLTDRRCLLTDLSIPLNQPSSELAYATLEKAWFSWYKWWQPRFPKP